MFPMQVYKEEQRNSKTIDHSTVNSPYESASKNNGYQDSQGATGLGSLTLVAHESRLEIDRDVRFILAHGSLSFLCRISLLSASSGVGPAVEVVAPAGMAPIGR